MNQTFFLTSGFEDKNPLIHHANIFELHATNESDYVILNSHDITDFTHNPAIFVTSTLEMLEFLLKHLDKNHNTRNI